MSYYKFIIIFCIFLVTSMFAEDKEINKLLEKLNQTPTSKEKQKLIEELKQKIAIENKRTQEKADAIIKAKKKIPLNTYNDPK